MPKSVKEEWERLLVFKEKIEQTLVFRGKSELDGQNYYGFSSEPTKRQWEPIKTYFTDFGTDDEKLQGWLTAYPDTVLRIFSK